MRKCELDLKHDYKPTMIFFDIRDRLFNYLLTSCSSKQFTTKHKLDETIKKLAIQLLTLTVLPRLPVFQKFKEKVCGLSPYF